MIAKFGLADAKFMCNMTLEGLALIIGRSQQHDIKCDLKFGHLTAASRKKHLKVLRREQQNGPKSAIPICSSWKKQIENLIVSERYIGGFLTPRARIFTPLIICWASRRRCKKVGQDLR